MPKEATLVEWNNDYYTYKQIADKEGITEKQAWYYTTQAGYTSSEQIAHLKARAKSRKASPQVEQAIKEALAPTKPKLPNEVTVSGELFKMLHWLTVSTSCSLQEAFVEFTIYMLERRVWGEDTGLILKARLLEKGGNENKNVAPYEYNGKAKQSRPELALLAIIDDLENEVIDLREWKAKVQKFLASLGEE